MSQNPLRTSPAYSAYSLYLMILRSNCCHFHERTSHYLFHFHSLPVVLLHFSMITLSFLSPTLCDCSYSHHVRNCPSSLCLHLLCLITFCYSTQSLSMTSFLSLEYYLLCLPQTYQSFQTFCLLWIICCIQNFCFIQYFYLFQIYLKTSLILNLFLFVTLLLDVLGNFLFLFLFLFLIIIIFLYLS